ncbi:MAG TPA: hypothetical protein EYQ85_07720 [Candidatus Poseidoniales archaeon]|jgi:asparagine N-glycosylation enzyme membrane subunit Stt3|nr:MAG: hypothetical protein CXT68_00120 [Euryarchaeota archaeon]HIF17118.1 hypothetical protein [Candidatus Poseidoniales archaeon]
MENIENEEKSGPALALGWLIAPLAVLMSFATSQTIGLDFMTAESGMVFGALIAAAILATVPRALRDSGKIQMSSSMLSLAFLGVILVLTWILANFTPAGSLAALLFLLLAVGGHIFDIRGRHEEQTILTFVIIGFMVALVIAGAADTWAGVTQDLINNNPSDEIQDGTIGGDDWDESYLNEHREATGFLFFSVWTVSLLLGAVIATLQRGVLFPAGVGRWWSFMPSREGRKPNASEWTMIAVMGSWALAHLATLYHFASSDMITRLELTVMNEANSHMSYWWAFFTGVVIMFIGFCVSERWFTRAMLVGVSWILYTVGGWQEAGWIQAEMLEGTQGLFIWAGITFFIFVGVFYIAGHDKWGGWDNRGITDPSKARQWWQDNWAVCLTFAAFVVALVVRTTWNIIPAMAASGTLGWDMTGGSDPWYMKRAVDYILAQHAHFIFDADRAYPIGGINPRPPLFAWSLALGGMMIAPFVGVAPSEAVWWSVAGLPALYGALTVFPLAAIARNQIGKGAGVISAWLIALMPGHVSHSTFALADHDAFVLLFLSLGMHYYLKAVQHGGSERMVKTISWRPSHLFEGMKAVCKAKPTAVGYSILAGMAIATVALGWKGFVYGPAIIFGAFALQLLLNLFRRRDSTILATLNIIMLSIVFLLPMPFYAHPQLGLVWDASGFQPMFYIFGFTLLAAFVVVAFRDKPWLMVFGTGIVMVLGVLAVLAVLQFVLNVYNGWDVLFTGGYYFSKNKIFGTIAEAQAPSRGTIFASFGPLVFIAALAAGMWALWQGVRHKKQTHLVLGIWVLLGAYMAWQAGRFIFNATPAMTVLGSWAIVGVWKGSGAGNVTKEWRRIGIRTPGDRFTSARKAVWRTPAFSALGLVMLMLISQHATYGVDAGIPRGSDAKDEIDSAIFHLTPDMFRFDIWDFSMMDNTPYEDGSSWYMGAFGPGFNGWGWNTAYDWLANQDLTHDESTKQSCEQIEGTWKDDVCHQKFGDRPAFVSWWDYGFQALAQGQHPSVSDNFQSGIPATGNMLLSRSQEDLVGLFIWQLTEGDLAYTNMNSGEYELSAPVNRILGNHLSEAELKEYIFIQSEMDSADAKQRTFTVESYNSDIVLATGGVIIDGILDESAGIVWRIYDGVDIVACEEPSSCIGGDYASEEQARLKFTQKTVKDKETVDATSHHIIGDYWYTNDLIDEFDDIASNLHRKNTRLALSRNLLTSALDSEEINALYSDLMSLDIYDVADSEGKPGETFQRNHEIRYFAVDNRLYPIGGRYNEDSRYNYGNPTGIFHAPTTLGGQDVDTFLSTTYETVRGGYDEDMSSEKYEEAYLQDILNQQQQGADYEALTLKDIRVDHTSAFFDTMIARTYVGYGASTLGLDVGSANPQPGQHFGVSGTPDSMMQAAPPLPAAMMNHFVISNWYGSGLGDESTFPEDTADQRSIRYANTAVKILKYYSGTEVCGKVKMSHGVGMNNTRVLVERDAFSGEHESDMDNNTYWIPIAAVDADENGDYCVTVPAGHIRFSAYLGDNDPIVDRDAIRKGDYQATIADFTTLLNENRETNPITGLLGGVSNMTWLNEIHLNVSGKQGHSGERYTESIDMVIETSGVSGTVSWAGHESFEGDPLIEVEFYLRSIWSNTDNYSVVTTNGSFTSDESRIVGPGQGEITFTENGTFTSSSNSETTFVKNFTGEYTRNIGTDQTYTGDGTWVGSGTIKANPEDIADNSTSNILNCEEDNGTFSLNLSKGWQICLQTAGGQGEASIYLFEGILNASGRMTAGTTTAFTGQLVNATFEGTGSFSGIGTINGTGTFIGIGTFSGPIVEPGSFYLSGLTPGTYNMIAQLENGKEVLLPQPVEVEINAKYGLELTMPGSLFSDTMYDMNGDLFANKSFELIDIALGEDDVIIINTDENGTFSYGPLSKGEYYYRFDLDGDGWYELNSTLFVFDESEELKINMEIPVHFDVNFSISEIAFDELGTADPEWDNRNRVVTIASKYDDYPEFNATSDENGLVDLELPRGHWIISDNNHESYMLWFDFELLEDEVSLGEKSYIHAVNVSGQVVAADDYKVYMDNPSLEHPFNKVPQVNVTMRSGNLVRYDVTDENGIFEVRLPAGLEFSITTISPMKTSTASILINVSSETNYSDKTASGGFLNLSMEPSLSRTGQLFIFEDALWDDSLPGWKPAEMTTTNNVSGVVWSSFTMTSGDFEFFLPVGNYTVDVLLEELNVSTSNLEVSADAEGLEWVLNGSPAYTDVQLKLFLDDNGDGVFENGTAVNVTLTLIPQLTGHGDQVNVTYTHYNISALTGVLNLSIEPGVYDVRIEQQNITDSANRTNYQTLTSVPFNTLEVPIGEMDEPYLIPLEPQWLLTAQVMNGVDPLDNVTIWLHSEDGVNFEKVDADENGNIVSYIPAGNWTAVLPQESRDNLTLEMQEAIIISEATANSDLTWNAIASTNISIHLSEAETGDNLSGFTITAVSKDGLRNVSIGPTDIGGNATGTLVTGEWTFFLNRSGLNDRWIIDEDVYSVSVDVSDAGGNLTLVEMEADKTVLIGGMIFWDLDGNGIQNNHEGIYNVSVHINSTDFESNLTTDEDGVWKLFAPILTNYSITASKVGFEAKSYDEYDVNISHESFDLALDAGNVSVSGNVTHLLDDISVLTNTSLKLYPVVGLDREVVVATTSLDGSTLSWDANVTPGKWVVWAAHEGANDDDFSVAIGLLDATVSDGGTLELQMSTGGWLPVSSEWTDFALQKHHLGESSVADAPINGSIELVIDLGDGMEFDLPVDSNGAMNLLLPSGAVSFSVEFTTIEMGMEMNYSGGVSSQVVGGVTQSEATIIVSRPARHDISFEVTSIVAGDATDISDDKKTMTAILVDATGDDLAMFEDIIITAKVSYAGNQAEEIFTLGGDSGALHDSEDWNVTFLNQSSGKFEQTKTVKLGLGENASSGATMNAEFTFKLQLPSQDIARFYSEGHPIGVSFEAGSTIAGELGLHIMVPQIHSIRLDSAPTEVGVAPGGEVAIDLVMTNLGNGEDTVSFNVSSSNLPTNWSLTPSSASMILSSTQERTQSFTIHAPADADDETYTFSISMEDGSGAAFIGEDNETLDDLVIEVSIARADLSIETFHLDGEAMYQGPTTFVVAIKNSGTLDANGVDVTVDVSALQVPLINKVAGTAKVDVPAGETVSTTVVVDLTNATLQKITLTATAHTTVESVAGGDTATEDYTNDVVAKAPDEANSWLPWIIISVILLGLYVGFKAMAARRGSKF